MRQQLIKFAMNYRLGALHWQRKSQCDMNQLQKYTWLIDTIRRAGKISHKDLSDK